MVGSRRSSLRCPGSSEVFRGGVVAYATDVKIAVLDVPEVVVEQNGVVSAECAREMARECGG